MNVNLEKVKIVVVGDSGISNQLDFELKPYASDPFDEFKTCFICKGVGKTAVVNLICHHTVPKKLSWTIGCLVDVKVNDLNNF
jgi:hypothetical protein